MFFFYLSVSACSPGGFDLVSPVAWLDFHLDRLNGEMVSLVV
jgi:hypothetical protein